MSRIDHFNRPRPLCFQILNLFERARFEMISGEVLSGGRYIVRPMQARS
jgi:hypothetical protein